MFVVLKSFSGVDYQLKSGKIISLKGGCFLNEVSKVDFDELLNTYSQVQEQIDNGYIIVNDNKEVAQKQSSKAVDDTKQTAYDKQKKAQDNIKKATNTDLKKESGNPKGKK